MTNDLADQSPRSFAFGRFVLLPERQLLLHGESQVRIGGRALDILTALVERPGTLVNKSELLARVWPDTTVAESNLKVNMAALRRALGEAPGASQYIATVVGRGYRFVAPVQSQSVGQIDASVEVGPPSTRNHNLPTGTTRIFGRADAVAAIRGDLDRSRLVSIVGSGGIGKTTVAVAVAEHVVRSFTGGVWLVDLAPLKDPALALNAIATAVGLKTHASSTLAALCEFLRDRQLLLVLDSCEHMIDAAASCANRILANAAGVKILATSREPLRMKGERVRRLPGLDTPPASAALDAKQALAFSAIQLFVERAAERLGAFELNDANAPIVAEICRRLDGLALAIEFAATRLDAFGVGELLAQLDGRLNLLNGHRASAERHRTLTATIDWSYALLSESERIVMRRLSTFAGAFSLDSACAIAADEHVDRDRVVEDLANLVAKSLITAESGYTEVEYRQLDTTRAYVLSKLIASGEFDAARRRHAEHVLDVAEQAVADDDRPPRAEWLARHGSHIDDIRDALNWAVNDAASALLAVRLTVAAIPFWRQLSLIEECRAAVERVLDGRFAAHRSAYDDLVLHLTLGVTLLQTRGHMLAVAAALTRALEIAEQLGDTDLRLDCLRALAECNLCTGDSRAALLVPEKLLAIDTTGHLAARADSDETSAGVHPASAAFARLTAFNRA